MLGAPEVHELLSVLEEDREVVEDVLLGGLLAGGDVLNASETVQLWKGRRRLMIWEAFELSERKYVRAPFLGCHSSLTLKAIIKVSEDHVEVSLFGLVAAEHAELFCQEPGDGARLGEFLIVVLHHGEGAEGGL